MNSIKEQIKRIPILGNFARQLYRVLRGTQPEPKPKPFPGSENYWEQRYRSGGNSGVGSYDKFAQFKAEILNSFVNNHNVKTVIEFGCGDGNQLSLANYPNYIGFDVSPTVINICTQRFSTDSNKTFKLMKDYEDETADLSLSLDVIYHLIEDEIFENYMRRLFEASGRYVIIYSSNSDDNEGYQGTHVRHRKLTKWIQNNLSRWKLIKHIPNKYPYNGDYRTGSFADFYIYEKV
jgi:hypothetical protein